MTCTAFTIAYVSTVQYGTTYMCNKTCPPAHWIQLGHDGTITNRLISLLSEPALTPFQYTATQLVAMASKLTNTL